MAFWRQKYNQTEGFSLVEVVVSITILGLVTVPMLSGLLWSYQLNMRSNERLQAQLAVSSAVETIMAEGFDETRCTQCLGCVDEETVKQCYPHRFLAVTIAKESKLPGETENYSGAARVFSVTAKSTPGTNLSDISVTTYARPYTAPPAPADPAVGGAVT